VEGEGEVHVGQLRGKAHHEREREVRPTDIGEEVVTEEEGRRFLVVGNVPDPLRRPLDEASGKDELVGSTDLAAAPAVGLLASPFSLPLRKLLQHALRDHRGVARPVLDPDAHVAVVEEGEGEVPLGQLHPTGPKGNGA